MNFYRIEPEVAGGLGENSVIDFSKSPPEVMFLHYKFDDWFGDALLTTSPCFIVTKEAANAIKKHDLSGTDIANVEVSTSELFEDLNPGMKLPLFHWLKVTGKAGVDDFGIARDRCLVVSERALGILKNICLSHADIQPY